VHGGRQQHGSDKQRVDENGETEPEAEFLQQVVPTEQKRAKDQDHDSGRGNHNPGCSALARK
jgi:hypothetical protein